MAWQDTLLDASFKGVAFACQAVRGQGVRSIAAHEFPYVAGADTEDMNLGPRRVQLRAVFWGDDYEDALQAFLAALESPGAGELVHPIYGAMQALSETWQDEHDADMGETCVVSVSFVEWQTRDVAPFSDESAAALADGIVDAGDDARAAVDDALARYVEQLPTDAARLSVLSDAFNQVKGWASDFVAAVGGALPLLSDLSALAYPRAFAADLLALVDAGIDALSFGGLNTAFLGTEVADGAKRMAHFDIVRVRMAPAGLVLVAGVPAPSAAMRADLAVVQAHARVYAAVAVADAAAIVLAGEVDAPVMGRAEVERLTGQVRAGLQVAIDGARAALDAEGGGDAAKALGTLAYQVQEAARAVVTLRPPLVSRSSPVDGPARLVAHALYGDPDRSAEIVALNALGRRPLVALGEVLRVYAR